MELSLKRDAHFDKMTCFVPGAFLDAKWSPKSCQNGAKKASRVYEKSHGFFDRKIHAVREALGSCFGAPGLLKAPGGEEGGESMNLAGGGTLIVYKEESKQGVKTFPEKPAEGR